MALGPKAMGEAIVANLKTKTGKDLSEWQSELQNANISDEKTARQFLKDKGLGHFQAMTVAELAFNNSRYDDETSLLDELFQPYPEQRALYELFVQKLKYYKVQPCRGYVPLYSDGIIVVSLKPTDKGLYAATNLKNPDDWQERVPHKPSLGGSERLKDGVYIKDEQDVKLLAGELSND